MFTARARNNRADKSTMGNCKSATYAGMPPAYEGPTKTPAEVTVQAIEKTLVSNGGIVSAELAEIMLVAMQATGVVYFPLGLHELNHLGTVAILRAVTEGFCPDVGQCVAEVNPMSLEMQWIEARPKLTPVRLVTHAYWHACLTGESKKEYHVVCVVSTLGKTAVEGMSVEWAMTIAEQIAEERNSAATFCVERSNDLGWAVTFD